MGCLTGRPDRSKGRKETTPRPSFLGWPGKGALLGVGLVLPLCGQAPKGKKYALLVGINVNDHGKLAAFKYAENDSCWFGR